MANYNGKYYMRNNNSTLMIKLFLSRSKWTKLIKKKMNQVDQKKNAIYSHVA